MKDESMNSTTFYPLLDGNSIEELMQDKALLEHLLQVMEIENLDDLFFDSGIALNRVNKRIESNKIENENQFIVNLYNLIHCFIKAQRYDIAAVLKQKTYCNIQNG